LRSSGQDALLAYLLIIQAAEGVILFGKIVEDELRAALR
jgi:hypothetical protein